MFVVCVVLLDVSDHHHIHSITSWLTSNVKATTSELARCYYERRDLYCISFTASSISIEHRVHAAPIPTPVPNAVIAFRVPPPPRAKTMLASPPITKPADTYMTPRSDPCFRMLEMTCSDDEDCEDWLCWDVDMVVIRWCVSSCAKSKCDDVELYLYERSDIRFSDKNCCLGRRCKVGDVRCENFAAIIEKCSWHSIFSFPSMHTENEFLDTHSVHVFECLRPPPSTRWMPLHPIPNSNA